MLIPVCPEQLGGMPTPRTGEKLNATGAEVLDGRLRIIAPETGKDVTQFHINGAKYTLEMAEIVGLQRASRFLMIALLTVFFLTVAR